MKRLLILLLSLFSVNLSFGQYHKFIEEGKVWVESYSLKELGKLPPDDEEMNFLFLDGDSTYQGKEYKILWSQRFYLEGWRDNGNIHLMDDTLRKAIPYVLMREDTITKRVYAVGNRLEGISGDEYLLYDFSLKVGDTLRSESNYGGLYAYGDVRLDSITIVNLPNGEQRKQYWYVGQAFIEGFGAEQGLIERLYYPGLSGWDEQVYINCVSKDSIQLYGDCSYPEYRILSTSEKFEEHGMLLYPNPASAQTTIDFGEMQVSANVQVLDGQGRVMMAQDFSGVAEGSLDLSSLGKGMYFIFVETDQGKRVTQVLMKE